MNATMKLWFTTRRKMLQCTPNEQASKNERDEAHNMLDIECVHLADRWCQERTHDDNRKIDRMNKFRRSIRSFFIRQFFDRFTYSRSHALSAAKWHFDLLAYWNIFKIIMNSAANENKRPHTSVHKRDRLTTHDTFFIQSIPHLKLRSVRFD